MDAVRYQSSDIGAKSQDLRTYFALFVEIKAEIERIAGESRCRMSTRTFPDMIVFALGPEKTTLKSPTFSR